MSYTLTIAGAPRAVVQDSLEINQELTYRVDTCRFQTLGARPNEGEEVIITDSVLGVMFGGVIVEVKLADTDAQLWDVDCNDYTELVDRRLVTETYEGMSASAIVSDIIAKYCTVDLLDAVTPGAPSVEYIQFNYIRPSECFKQLCEYVGWSWYIDYAKQILFFNPASLLTPAPLQLTSATRGLWGDFKVSIATMNLRNRTYVIGGSMLSDLATFEFKADGVQVLYPLGHKPHGLSMEVNAIPVSVGVENLHEDDGTYDYFLNYQEKYVVAAAATPPVAAGTTVAFTYTFDIPVIIYDEDGASQMAVAAVQGGDGIYEHMIHDSSIVTLEAAYALAQQDLREWADPTVKGSFLTATPGWVPGQILTINLADRGIANQYMIQDVRLTYKGAWIWDVAFGGRLISIADFLQALVSRQQKAEVNTSIITKIKTGTDPVGVADVSVETLRAMVYVCGDADAICGFVELNGTIPPSPPIVEPAFFLGPWMITDNTDGGTPAPDDVYYFVTGGSLIIKE